MARLDRLAAVKEIAQIGAAIGREFSYALLQAVVGRDEATLRAALAQLEESELVFRAGEPPAARYTFKHALVQDTAYESLLEEPPANPAPAHRRGLARQVPRRRRGRAGTDRRAFHASRPHRTRDRPLGQGGRPRAAPLGVQGGDRASGQGDRDDGGGGEQAEKPGGKLKLQVSLRQRPDRRARLRRAGNRRRLRASQGNRGRRRRIGRMIFGDLWAVVGSLSARRLSGHARTRRRFSSRCRGATEHARRLASRHRIAGMTLGSRANFEARALHLEQALAIFDAERDGDPAFVSARTQASPPWSTWRSRCGRWAKSIARSGCREAWSAECGTRTCRQSIAYGPTRFVSRADARTSSNARLLPLNALARVAREHEMQFWSAYSVIRIGLGASGKTAIGDLGLAEMRRGLANDAGSRISYV